MHETFSFVMLTENFASLEIGRKWAQVFAMTTPMNAAAGSAN